VTLKSGQRSLKVIGTDNRTAALISY